MAGFIPAIHDFGAVNKTWMAATRAAMTVGEGCAIPQHSEEWCVKQIPAF